MKSNKKQYKQFTYNSIGPLKEGHGEGFLVNGLKQGRRLYEDSFGIIEKGNFINNKKEGKRVYIYPDGGKAEGLFLNDKPVGKWIYKYPNGRMKVKDF